MQYGLVCGARGPHLLQLHCQQPFKRQVRPGVDPAIYNVNRGCIAIGHPFGKTGAGLFEVLQSAAAPSSGALSSSSKCRGVQAAETVATWCGPLAVAPAWWLSGTSDEAAGAARDVTKDATKDAAGGARQPAGRIPAGINEGIY
jgi:hypothetical protein